MVNAARHLPQAPIALLAANDNAGGALSARARSALAQPLHNPLEPPPAACRRWHTVSGERCFSSILVVEPSPSGPVWRMSVMAWGYVDDELAALGWLLAHQSLAGLGVGELVADASGSTTFVRRALSPAERARLAQPSELVERR